MPSFEEPLLPRISTCYSWLASGWEDLFPLAADKNSELGVKFALYRCFRESSSVRMDADTYHWIEGWVVAYDLAAVSHLDKVRSGELKLLREALMVAEPDQNLSMSY